MEEIPMQHCPARAAQRLAAAVLALVLLLCAFLPRAHAAELKEKNGIRLLSFDTSHILSIGNQTSGKCSLYALRYARTILDGKVCSGSGMWSNGAVWSAAGYTGYSGTRAECLKKLYSELSAGHPVIVHLKNTTVSGVKRHTNRTSTYEYHLTGWVQNEDDGSVTLEVQGDPDKFMSLFAMIQKSDYIQITGIRSKNIPPDPWERGFSVKGY